MLPRRLRHKVHQKQIRCRTCNNVPPYTWLEKVTPTFSSEDQFCDTTRGPLVHQGNPGEHSGAKIQPNFFSQKIVDKGHATELYHMELAKYETAIKQGRLVAGGFEGKKGRQAAYSCQPTDKNPDNKYKAYKQFEASPRRDPLLWTWGACNRRTSGSTKPSSALRHLLQHDP